MMSLRSTLTSFYCLFVLHYVESQVIITLYTRSIPNGVQLTQSNKYSNSAYSNTKVTKFTINGWVYNWDPTFPNITKAYLKKTDLNVININWSAISGDMNGTVGLQNFNAVGNVYLDLLTNLIASGSNANNFHLIGHGLGAHVAGYAAQRLFATKNVKVNRLTGLDPTIQTIRNLTSTDAQFVDVIHTTDVYGTYKALGIVDFFPNNALVPQAGCGFEYVPMIACSHYMSVIFFGNSIKNGTLYLATKCTNYENYKDSLCTRNATTYMGESVARNATGSYYLSVYLRSSNLTTELKRMFGPHHKHHIKHH
nr:lipase member H-like [Onthophagus taurus]